MRSFLRAHDRDLLGNSTAAFLILLLSAAFALGSTSVVVWGDGANGQTNIPPGLTNVVAIAAGSYNCRVVKSDGTTFGWPSPFIPSPVDAIAISSCYNQDLLLNLDGTVSAYGSALTPPGLSNVVGIAAAGANNWALKSDGTLFGWGGGDLTTPVFDDFVSIAANLNNSLGLRSDGTVVSWDPELFPVGFTNVTSIAQGWNDSLAVKSDRTVVAWRPYYSPVAPVPAGLSNVVSVAAGELHSLALRNDGTVVAWGDNTYGQTNVPTGLSNVVAIAAGRSFSMALVSDDPVFIAGQPFDETRYRGQRALLSVLAMGSLPITYQWEFQGKPLRNATNSFLVIDNVQPTNAGAYTVLVSNRAAGVVSRTASLAVVDGSPIILLQPSNQVVVTATTPGFSIIAKGTLPMQFQWQFNGQDIPGATNSTRLLNAVEETNSGNYRVVITNSLGSITSQDASLTAVPTLLVGWGTFGAPPFEPTTTFVAISSGNAHSVALRNDGSLIAWGDNSYNQTSVPADLTNVTAISAGGNQTLAILSDGSVRGWGTPGSSAIPQGLSNIVAVAAGNAHGLALGSDGKVLAWGTFSDGTSSTPPPGLVNVAAIASGVSHCLALKKNGTVVAWGLNNAGQINVPPGLSNVLSIAAGAQYSIALKEDGSVAVWGDRFWGETFVPSDLTNALALAHVNGAHCLALKNEGEVSAWGYSAYGQIAVPPNLTNAVALAGGGTYSIAILRYGAPVIVRQPLDKMAWTGDSISTSAGVLGSKPMSFQWVFNGSNIAGATESFLRLTNVQVSQSGNYSLVVSNAFGLMTSSNVSLDVLDVEKTLGTTNLLWSEGGDLPWFWEDTVAHNSIAAMQSGSVSPPQKSILQAQAVGPGTLTFWWRLSTAYGSGAAILSANGVPLAQTAGYFIDWHQETVYVGDGAQTLQWTFNPSSQQDAAWLDQVSFLPGSTSPGLFVTPTNQTVSAGNTASFKVSAFGTPPLSYQWQLNGADIPSATNTSLMLSNLQAKDAGIYTIIVSNAYGNANWNATLDVTPIAPVFVVQPSSQRLYLNEPAALVGTAKGSEPITYQWQFNGSNIDGATSALLAFKNIQISNSGTYVLIASNAIGLTATSSALLTVGSTLVAGWSNDNFSPGVPTIPLDLTNGIAISAGVSHQVILRSDGTVTEWADFSPGQTKPPDGLTNVVAIACTDRETLALRRDGTLAAWGLYYMVTNLPVGLSNVVAIGCGAQHCLAVESNGRVVAWGNNTSGQTSVPPDLDNVIAVAAGYYFSTALKRDGTVVAWGSNSGGETNLPPLTNVVAISAGYDYALALNSDGTVTPWGHDFEGDAEVPTGTSNVVALASEGSHNLALQSDGTLVPWGVFPYIRTNLPPGLTRVEALACGGTFDFALLNDGSPLITRQLADQWVFSGTPVFMSVTAMGEMPISYGWQFNGTNISGATKSWLYLPAVSSSNAGTYSVFVTNSVGAIVTSSAQLSITSTPPSISMEPSSQVVSNNASVVLRVVADGSYPLSYQWFKDTQTVANATNDSLLFTSIQSVDSGGYYVTVSNSFGSVTSEIAQITVLGFPVITTQPTNQVVLAGATVNFNVAATGSPPLIYQWFLNGSPLPTATNTSLTLANAQPAQAGAYTITVSNGVGTATSIMAQLIVFVRPSLTLVPSGVIKTAVSISLNSVAGVPYTLQYKNALTDAGWTSILPTMQGTGQAVMLSDTNRPSASSRFYRVVPQ